MCKRKGDVKARSPHPTPRPDKLLSGQDLLHLKEIERPEFGGGVGVCVGVRGVGRVGAVPESCSDGQGAEPGNVGAAWLPSVVGVGWGMSFVSLNERENKQGHRGPWWGAEGCFPQSPQPAP